MRRFSLNFCIISERERDCNSRLRNELCMCYKRALCLLPLGNHRQVTPWLLCACVRSCVRRWIGRIGCALFSSNWYCLAHGHGRHAATGGRAGGRHAYSAAAAAAVVSLAISPPAAGQVSQPAARWPKSQVETRSTEGEGERDTNIRCGQVDGDDDEEPFFLLSGHSLRAAQSESPLFSRNLI